MSSANFFSSSGVVSVVEAGDDVVDVGSVVVVVILIVDVVAVVVATVLILSVTSSDQRHLTHSKLCHIIIV